MKKAEFLEYLATILAKKWNQNRQQYFLSLKIKSRVLLSTTFTYFSKTDEILGKNSGKIVLN